MRPLMFGELAVSAVLVVELAIWVAMKAMKRKKKVPTNSPMKATASFLMARPIPPLEGILGGYEKITLMKKQSNEMP